MMIFTFLAIALLAQLQTILAQVQGSGLTGDSYCGEGYCLTAVYDASKKLANYTLVVPQGPQQLGWYGIGQGTQMAGANIAVNWVNADGTVTTSHRAAQGEFEPQESYVTVKTYSPNSDVSKTSTGQTVWSWNWPLPAGDPQNAVNHIFAMCPTSPSSSATNTDIQKHNRHQQGIVLDLTKAYTGAAPAGVAGSTQSQTSTQASKGSRDLSKNYTRIYIVHMVFMIIGWMICFPAGILLARYGRTMFLWFPKHRIVQTIGYVFVFIAFFLAVAAVSIQNIPHFSSTHQKLGLALFILLFVQMILGVASHSLKQRKGLRHIGYVHIPLGLILFGLSVWQIHLGFDVWDWQPPAAASYPIYAWAALMFVLYVAGFIFLPKELRQAKDEKVGRVGSDRSSNE